MMFVKIVLCYAFLCTILQTASSKQTPSVKKQVEIIATKIDEHMRNMLQPLERIDDSRKEELKRFARKISDIYNEMAVQLQVKIEEFVESVAGPHVEFEQQTPPDVEFGTMYTMPTPATTTSTTEPPDITTEPPELATTTEEPEEDTKIPMLPLPSSDFLARTFPPPPMYDDGGLAVEYTHTAAPKSSEEDDGYPANPLKMPHVPIYYNGGKQKAFSDELLKKIQSKIAADKKKALIKKKTTTTTPAPKKMSSSEEDRLKEVMAEKQKDRNNQQTESEEKRFMNTRRILNIAKKLQASKYRKKTSSEEDREREVIFLDINNKNEQTNKTSGRYESLPVSSEEINPNRRTITSIRRETTERLPPDSSEEVNHNQQTIKRTTRFAMFWTTKPPKSTKSRRKHKKTKTTKHPKISLQTVLLSDSSEEEAETEGHVRKRTTRSTTKKNSKPLILFKKPTTRRLKKKKGDSQRRATPAFNIVDPNAVFNYDDTAKEEMD